MLSIFPIYSPKNTRVYLIKDGSVFSESTKIDTSGVTVYSTHKVVIGETLRSIATKYYGSTSNRREFLWYIIADFNGVENPLSIEGITLKIPKIT